MVLPETMYENDPFAEPAFLSRLQKLLPMLASTQPGEADAARRKLIEHLAHARLSLTDVSNRLGTAPQAASSFLQGAREMSLERQLSIARTARHEAEADAALARAKVAELQAALQQSTMNVGKALQGQARGRTFAALGFCAAAISLMVAGGAHFGPLFPRGGSAPPPTVQAAGDAASDPTLKIGRGERLGTALVQDLAVRLAPNESAGVRAFLNQGTRVAISGQERVGPQNWLYIRSGSGFGWVRAGDVLH